MSSSKRRRREFEDMILGELGRASVIEFKFKMRGEHPSVEFVLPNGRSRFHVYPGTPAGDPRSLLNNRSNLRRIIREGMQ